MSKKLWDFECECGFKEERLVEYEEKSIQICCACGAIMRCCIPLVAGWVSSAERTAAQLKKRSEDHTAWLRKTGNDPNANCSQRCTDAEWRNRTRPKNTRKGVVAEKARSWKGFAEKPPIEILPGGR